MKIDDLFIVSKKKSDNFDTQRWFVIIERLLSLCVRLVWLIFAFWGFDKLGQMLANNHVFLKGTFDSNLLYSIFLIPTLYALKNSFRGFFDSLFVVASQDSLSITVKRGWIAKSYDKLFIKNINNAEVYKTFIGAVLGYFQLDLYAVGGVISIPYLKDNEHNNKLIKNIMEQIKKNQSVNKDE